MRRPSWSRCIWAAGLCIVCMLASLPSPATAQERRPSPSAKHLWQDYPLEPTPEARARPTAAAGEPAPAPRTSAAEDDGGGSPPMLLLLIAAALVAAGLAVLALRRLRARSPAAPLVAAALPPGNGARSPLVSIPSPPAAMPTTERSPRLALASSSDPRGARRDGHKAARQTSPVEPPNPWREWSAEIEWHHGTGGSRFRLVARSPSAPETAVLDQSDPLEWPPSGPESVVTMRRAVESLQAAALEAGWQPAPAGRAWYSRRFRWEAATPAVAAPAPAPAPASKPRPARTGRFARSTEWPPDTADLPRCEIIWDVGYLKSRFRATVFEPGARRGEAACSSKPFRGYLAGTSKADPDELRAEVKALVDTMTEAGWEPAGRGARWFSFRFVWRRPEAPDLQPEKVSHAVD